MFKQELYQGNVLVRLKKVRDLGKLHNIICKALQLNIVFDMQNFLSQIMTYGEPTQQSTQKGC